MSVPFFVFILQGIILLLFTVYVNKFFKFFNHLLFILRRCLNSNKLRFIGEIEFANWQRNGNGRLIASPTSNIYPITVGEDIILPQNVRKICDLWIDLHDKSKFV